MHHRANSRDLLIEELKSGITSPGRSIEIADAGGRLLESVAVRSALN